MSSRRLCLAAAAWSAVLLAATARGQQDEPLRLEGMAPGGARKTTTTAWTAFDFSLTNFGDGDRLARVVAFFPQRQEVQYGRDVWVPARAELRSWLLVGPAPEPASGRAHEVRMELIDRTGGQWRRVPPPGEAHVRSRPVRHRKREPATAVVLDDLPGEGIVFGRLPQPDAPAAEALRLVRTARLSLLLSEEVTRVEHLPPNAEGLDGVDHLVIASGRIADDPAGLRAVRGWLARGGKVWVMLDRVEPDAVAALLGEAVDFHLVDRVSLTSFRIDTQGRGQPSRPGDAQTHERPIEFARVLLPEHERPRHTIDGWPAWFSRPVGRGVVVFTTLGPRGWYRPRVRRRDRASPYENFPDQPVPTLPLDAMAGELYKGPDEPALKPAAFRTALTEEVGYHVVDRGTAALVFATFLLGTLGLGVAVRRSRRPELLGWLAPAAALLAAGAFVGLGEGARRAVPATVAAGQIVAPVDGSPEVDVHGLLAVYRPAAGTVPAAATGGLFDLDAGGADGQVRQFILTDIDAWRLEGLALPAGLRLAPFRLTAPTGRPISAVARFGPQGLQGKLDAGPFRGLSDALLHVPGARRLAVRIDEDGAFRAGGADALPAGQFIAAALLDDRRQRRQELYREFLRPPLPPHLARGPVLFAWAEPLDTGFTIAPGAQSAGAALLAVPLRLERLTPGETVTVPAALLTLSRISKEGPQRMIPLGRGAAKLHLRFQLPAPLLPFEVERARLLVRIDAAGRRVRVAGGDGAEVAAADSPIEPMLVELSGAGRPRADADGGLHLYLDISGPPGATPEWKIDTIELEVAGRSR